MPAIEVISKRLNQGGVCRLLRKNLGDENEAIKNYNIIDEKWRKTVNTDPDEITFAEIDALAVLAQNQGDEQVHYARLNSLIKEFCPTGL